MCVPSLVPPPVSSHPSVHQVPKPEPPKRALSSPLADERAAGVVVPKVCVCMCVCMCVHVCVCACVLQGVGGGCWQRWGGGTGKGGGGADSNMCVHEADDEGQGAWLRLRGGVPTCALLHTHLGPPRSSHPPYCPTLDPCAPALNTKGTHRTPLSGSKPQGPTPLS